MKVLIIGGTGFLGYHATKELIQRGHDVSILALPPLPAEGLFPVDVKINLADIAQLADNELNALFSQHEAIVFAAGVDDRVTPRKPAYPFFYHHNVESVKRIFNIASDAGIKRGVVLGSYFAYFDRTFPDLHLAEHHPYIRSRVEQEKAAIQAGGHKMAVMILELPYIFGSMPGRVPLWKPLIHYVSSKFPIFYPKGGTTCVSVTQVAQAIAGALENGEAGYSYPIGGVNLSWVELLTRLGYYAGAKPRIITLPNIVCRFGAFFLKIYHLFHNLESGLDPVKFITLQTMNTYINSSQTRMVLKYSEDNLDTAFRDTVEATRH